MQSFITPAYIKLASPFCHTTTKMKVVNVISHLHCVELPNQFTLQIERSLASCALWNKQVVKYNKTAPSHQNNKQSRPPSGYNSNWVISLLFHFILIPDKFAAGTCPV